VQVLQLQPEERLQPVRTMAAVLLRQIFDSKTSPPGLKCVDSACMAAGGCLLDNHRVHHCQVRNVGWLQ
jgi:hypothetical protein